MPKRGRKALTWKMNSMLVLSASHPKKAEPRPPKPNISPKKMPAISPTLSGIKSVAYTTIDENAEAIIKPDKKVQIIVQVRLANGMMRANGEPDDILSAKLVAQHTSCHCSDGKGGEEDKEAELRCLNRDAKLVYQEESEVTRDAGGVKVFREHQQDENQQSPVFRRFRDVVVEQWLLLWMVDHVGKSRLVPSAQSNHDEGGDEGGDGKP